MTLPDGWTANDLFDAISRLARQHGPMLREYARRRDAGECVAHDGRGVRAVMTYDGDPVCEDCAVAYLREDIEERDRG